MTYEEAMRLEIEELINEKTALRAQLAAATERAEKAEAERELLAWSDNAKGKQIIELAEAHDTLAARVAEMEGALEAASRLLCKQYFRLASGEIGPEKAVTLQALKSIGMIIDFALVRTPAQSLARVKAAAVREAATALNSNVLGNGDYYAGMEAGIESAKNTFEDIADRLEAEAANG